MEKGSNGQHCTPGYGPGAANGDNGQRTRMKDQRNRTAVSYTEAIQRDFPTREEMEREQQRGCDD